MGRGAPRPDTTNASGPPRTPVPAGVRRRSSARAGHTARASSRTPLQNCIPTPRIERHTPVPRGVCAVSHLPSPRSTGPGPPASMGASNGGGSEIQLCPRSGTTPRISVTSPRNRGFSGAVRGPQCASRFGLTLEFELGVQGVSSRACSSGPRRGRFGAGTPGASRSTNQSNRRDLGVCAREHRESGFGAIDSARRPAAETSLRRARGKRCPNLRR